MSKRRCLACSTTYPLEDHACPKCGSHAGDVVQVERATSTKPKRDAGRHAPSRKA
jgi:rRNA maturation endonuclease Nob1